MKSIINRKLLFVSVSISIFHSIVIAQILPKQSIKANGQIIYNVAQQKVDKISDIFQKGEFYGRLRSNNFYFEYETPTNSKISHFISGAGASAVFKSAEFYGVDLTVGHYGSRAMISDDSITYVSALKAGKDTLSRHKYANGGSKSMSVTAQANIKYRVSKTTLTLGRQLIETFYTKSNDTKMVPNSFDGFVLHSKDIDATSIKLAYLDKQKLRDHEKAHSVLMVGDANSSSSTKPQWSENDDAGMHKGLTYTALTNAGKPTDAPLIIADVENESIKNLKLNFSSYYVKELLSSSMLEFNYKMQYDGFTLSPGMRFIYQKDLGAGDVGSASLKGFSDAGINGYKNINSLDARMIAARLVAKVEDYKINLGYTNILDKADLVTPWRGFPTAGYTRSMGIYNWRANDKSYRIEVVKGANKTGVYKTPFIQTSILYMDADEDKALSDSMLYYAGLVQNIPSHLELQYRVRLGYREFIGSASSVSNYLDARFEVNYLF